MNNSLLLLGLIFLVIYMLNNKLLKKFIGGDELDTKLVLEDKPMKMQRKEFLKKMLDENNNKPTDLLDIKEDDVVVDTQLEKKYSIQKNELDDLKEKHSDTVRRLNSIKKQQAETKNELEGYKIMNYYDLNNDKQIDLKEIVTVLNSNKKIM